VIKSRRVRLAGHLSCTGARRSAHRFVVRKFEGKRPLGGLRYRWGNNIKMNLHPRKAR